MIAQGILEEPLDRMGARLMAAPGLADFDYAKPAGAPALVGPDSVSWQIFKNPVALFVGGVAAVLLELAEPAVRSGVWEHSSFRREPVPRLQRTGAAAMMTVYGPSEAARRMIAGVVRRHEAVEGATPAGEAYRANDPKLLDWVQATATFGFAGAYDRYVRPLGPSGLDRAFAEAEPAARLYGATGAPRSWAEWESALERMRDRLEPSPIVDEFLGIMRDAPALPRVMRPLQRLMIRGAVDLLPGWVRDRLWLSQAGLRRGEAWLLQRAAGLADRIVLRSAPPAQSSLRLGLPADYLYKS
ncbi:oxygenase MpaB family protein [Roseococcus sp. YIM B11640]|uniref:oxygenase MpaB family protein n=1 Tax=Roseococcus sp. YIM B11640 TaxID=3133973 RepID=UPI003C7A1732